MKHIIKASLILGIVMVTLPVFASSGVPSVSPSPTGAPTPSVAPTVSSGGSSAASGETITATGNADSGTLTRTVSTGGTGSSTVAPHAPSVGSGASSAQPGTDSGASSAQPGTDSGASSAHPGTDSGASSTGSPSPTPTPVIPPSNPGTTNTSGASTYWLGGSSSGGGGVPLMASTMIDGTVNSCPLLSVAVMERGWKNNPVQVAKLQSFLKNTQEVDVDVTGTFDQKTEDAVKVFQSRYMSAIMGPWGSTAPSGIVYITTVKKINEIACNQALTLTPSELATINAYKSSQLTDNTAGATATLGSDASTTANATATLDVASTDGSNNIAGVGSLSIFAKFWNFIVSLFR